MGERRPPAGQALTASSGHGVEIRDIDLLIVAMPKKTAYRFRNISQENYLNKLFYSLF